MSVQVSDMARPLCPHGAFKHTDSDTYRNVNQEESVEARMPIFVEKGSDEEQSTPAGAAPPLSPASLISKTKLAYRNGIRESLV